MEYSPALLVFVYLLFQPFASFQMTAFIYLNNIVGFLSNDILSFLVQVCQELSSDLSEALVCCLSVICLFLDLLRVPKTAPRKLKAPRSLYHFDPVHSHIKMSPAPRSSEGTSAHLELKTSVRFQLLPFVRNNISLLSFPSIRI